MIEYPDCDQENCWYRNNFDRLNEYNESYTYVHNRDVDKREYNLLYYTGPIEITLCDVDQPNIVGKCALCERMMIDKWINEDFIICRLCIDDGHIDNELDEDGTYDDIFNETKGNYVDSLESLEKDKSPYYQVLFDTILRIYNRERKIKDEKESEIMFGQIRQREKSIKMLTKLFPELTNEQKDDILNKHKELPIVDSVFDLLMKL